MEKPTTNWPRQLATIAADPDDEEVTGRCQLALLRFRGLEPPRRQVSIMQSRGLVSRGGLRLPLSHIYELIETTLPVAALMASSAGVMTALARYLNDPERYRSTLLTACVEAANLTTEREMLQSTTAIDRPRMVEALFGAVDLDPNHDAIVGLATTPL